MVVFVLVDARRPSVVRVSEDEVSSFDAATEGVENKTANVGHVVVVNEGVVLGWLASAIS